WRYCTSVLTAATPQAAIVWKPLIVTPHPERVRLLQPALLELGSRDPYTLTDYPRTGTIAAVAHQNGCNICFLDIAADQEHALQLAPEAAATIPVVGLSPPNDADLILRCLRLGVSEFVSEPGSEQIRAILERFARARAPLPQRAAGCVYCVIPGKPGCGAST